MKKNKNIWLIGSGTMAIEYAKVLAAQQISFTCIGRGRLSAENFKRKTGFDVVTGGIQAAINKKASPPPKYVIVAVPNSELSSVAISLIEWGVKHILLEKPGGLDYNEIEKVSEIAKQKDADVKIAYNRRFYASVLAAEEFIKKDGGVTSFNFEFTEWLDMIKNAHVNDNNGDIFLGNSTHVIDMAFFLGGNPKEMACYSKSEKGQYDEDCVRIFTGAGISVTDAFFSYQANWSAPGRWSVEILTSYHRLIFRPLEQLYIQKKGSISIEKVEIDDTLDKTYKPGLYREVEAFLGQKDANRFLTIHDQVAQSIYYKKMQGII
jgi:predicted dehydrogenase